MQARPAKRAHYNPSRAAFQPAMMQGCTRRKWVPLRKVMLMGFVWRLHRQTNPITLPSRRGMPTIVVCTHDVAGRLVQGYSIGGLAAHRIARTTPDSRHAPCIPPCLTQKMRYATVPPLLWNVAQRAEEEQGIVQITH